MAQAEDSPSDIVIHLVNPYRCGDCGAEFCERTLFLEHLAEYIAILKNATPCHQIVCTTSLVEPQPNSTTITRDILQINDQQMFELQDTSLDYTQITPLKVLEQAGILNLPRPLQVKTPGHSKPLAKENSVLALDLGNTDVRNDGRKVSLLKNQELHPGTRSTGSSHMLLDSNEIVVQRENSNMAELDSLVQQALFDPSKIKSLAETTSDQFSASQSLIEMLAPGSENIELENMDNRSGLKKSALFPSVMRKESKIGVVCSICSAEFANARVLQRHQVIHTGAKPYNCNVCFKEFNDISSHRKHSLIHKRQHRCPVCHRMYLRRTQLLLHMKQHRKKKFIQFGSGFFEVQISLIRSADGQLIQEYNLPVLQGCERTEHQVQSPKADDHTFAKDGISEIAVRTNLTMTENEYHVNITSGESTLESQLEMEQNKKTVYRCGHCKTIIFTRPTLFRHLIKHTNTKPFQCEKCLKSFHDKADLLHHHKTHTKPVQCQTCNSSFSKHLYLQNHLLKGCPVTANDSRFTVLSDLRCQCNICHKILKSKATILRHLRVHAFQERRQLSCQNVAAESLDSCVSEKLSQSVEDHFQCLPHSVGYSCLICRQEFRFKSFMITHVRMHLNQRPYKCQDCSKSFFARHMLKKHQQNHTKPYSCPVCNKSFIRRYIMRNHFKKRHEQEDPLKDVTELPEKKLIQCDICGKTMKSYQKSVMLCHIRLHKDVRPFSCRVCNKSFISDNAVRKHSLNHTRPYKCHICSKGFSRRYLLTDHFRKKCGRKKGGNSTQKDLVLSSKDDSVGQVNKSAGNLPSDILTTSRDEIQPYEAKIIKEQDLSTGTVTYTCEPCDKRFTVYEALVRHINTFSKPTACKYCRQVFEDKHVTMLHQRSCLGLFVPAQDYSKRSSTLGKQQEKVQKIMKDISMKIENITSKSSSSEVSEKCSVKESVDSKVINKRPHETLLRNLSSHSEEETISVADMSSDTCQSAIRLPNTCTLPSLVTRQDKFSCPECQRSFETARGLKIHASSHVRLFKCDNCEQDFTQITDLRAHARMHTAGVEVSLEPEAILPAPSPDKQQQLEEAKHGTHSFTESSQEQTSPEKSVISRKRSRKISAAKKSNEGDDDILSEKVLKHQTVEEVSQRLMQSGTRGRPYSCKLCRRRFTQQFGLHVHLMQNHGIKP